MNRTSIFQVPALAGPVHAAPADSRQASRRGPFMSVTFEYTLTWPDRRRVVTRDADEADAHLDAFATSGAAGWLEVSARVVKPPKPVRRSAVMVEAAGSAPALPARTAPATTEARP